MQWVVRWRDTEAWDEAQDLMDDMKAEKKQMKKVEAEFKKEFWKERPAFAKYLEKNKRPGGALVVWKALAKMQGDTDEGKEAAKEVKRLEKYIAGLPKKPFIGVMFQGMTLKVATVVPKGPAEEAGIKPGDTIIKLGDVKVANFKEMGKALEKYKPGDTAKITVQRGEKPMTIEVKLGTKPVD